MPAPIGNAPLLPLHESKSAMLPRSSFLLSYTPLDCSISPGIISGTSVIIFQNCSLRPCYLKKKKNFYFHYLPGGNFYPVPHLALLQLNLLLGFLVQPGEHERRSWREPEQNWYNHTQPPTVWTPMRKLIAESLFAVEERKGHNSFQMSPFRICALQVPSSLHHL